MKLIGRAGLVKMRAAQVGRDQRQARCHWLVYGKLSARRFYLVFGVNASLVEFP